MFVIDFPRHRPLLCRQIVFTTGWHKNPQSVINITCILKREQIPGFFLLEKCNISVHISNFPNLWYTWYICTLMLLLSHVHCYVVTVQIKVAPVWIRTFKRFVELIIGQILIECIFSFWYEDIRIMLTNKRRRLFLQTYIITHRD